MKVKHEKNEAQCPYVYPHRHLNYKGSHLLPQGLFAVFFKILSVTNQPKKCHTDAKIGHCRKLIYQQA